MKKTPLIILLILILSLSCTFFACQNKENTKTEYTIVSPDGAPALSLVGLIGKDYSKKSFSFSPSIVSSTLIASEAIKSDFAIVPVNLAANLYNKGKGYLMAAVVTNGNMYIVSNKENSNFTLENLKGKKLYTIGQGSVPAFILESLLKKSNINYKVSETVVDENTVSLQYCSDGTALIQKLAQATKSGETVYGNLAEPAVSNMVNKNIGYSLESLQTLWQSATNSSINGFAQAVLIVKEEIYKNNKDIVDAMILELSLSANNILADSTNIENAIKSLYPETTIKTMSQNIIFRCNVKTYRAKENADYIIETLNAVYELKQEAVGGQVPDKDSGFYI